MANPSLARDQLIASIRRSAIASIVTDPNADDNPIIAANSGFTKLTGYAEQELLGRNCRLLAGRGTSPERSAMLRRAIATRTPTIVELQNYRKDGTSFANAVMVAPVFDEQGELAFFVGSQMEAGGDRSPAPKRAAADRLSRLTGRQSAVLSLVAQGQRNRQIAEHLGLSEKTIRMYRVALVRRLGVTTMAEAMRIAIEAEM